MSLLSCEKAHLFYVELAHQRCVAAVGVRKLVPVLAKVDRERCKDRWSGFLVSEEDDAWHCGVGAQESLHCGG